MVKRQCKKPDICKCSLRIERHEESQDHMIVIKQKHDHNHNQNYANIIHKDLTDELRR